MAWADVVGFREQDAGGDLLFQYGSTAIDDTETSAFMRRLSGQR